MLEAKDLPRCDLSDYIEHRLQLALGRDRADRARLARVGVEQARPMQPLLVGFRVQPQSFEPRAPGARGRRAGAARAAAACGFRVLGSAAPRAARAQMRSMCDGHWLPVQPLLQELSAY